MEPSYLLYLRLKIDHNDDYLNSQFQNNGFKLMKKTGAGIETFRKYYYEMKGAPDALEVSFTIMPGKNTTQTISIQLADDIHPKHVERLFDYLVKLALRVPFDLLDMSIRNRIYEQLRLAGKVDAYYVGLPESEQVEVEKQAYIPIDHKLFLERFHTNPDKALPSDPGERAPDIDF